MATDDLQLYLRSGSRSIDLYPWLRGSPQGIEALAGITGFGMPQPTTRWFEGAGDGAIPRGRRIQPREIELPFTAEAPDRATLLEEMSNLASILMSPEPIYLEYMLPDGDLWFVQVTFEGGGDWKRQIESGRNYINSYIFLKAGDPYWTRRRAESFSVNATIGVGLMPFLAQLRVSPTGAFGERAVTNIGDATAYPEWTLRGPFSGFRLANAHGDVLEWHGDIAFGQGIKINTKNATVVDLAGNNRYDGLVTDPPPEFWAIEPGESTVQVELFGVGAQSYLQCEWAPRRWLVV